MKICKIYIKNFEQFQDIELDFTNPETVEPLDKICFIGSNGTGKSKLLHIIKVLFLELIPNLHKSVIPHFFSSNEDSRVIYKVKYLDSYYFIYHTDNRVSIFKFNAEIITEEEFIKRIFAEELDWGSFRKDLLSDDFLSKFRMKGNSNDLVIYSPAESSHNGYKDIEDVPKTSVNEALSLSKEFPFHAEVSSEKVDIFWKLLVFNLRKRAEEKDNFENQPNNLLRIKQDLITEFDSYYPKILDRLEDVWNKILDRAGLYFDVKGANNPYQLTDNLKAYIKLKSNDQVIPYGELSTGIRNYIFRLGHIFSLYFDREIDRGFLLVDEPENSLFPDFLFDLMDTYKNVIVDKRGENNTQVFFATHNPIVAGQFQPYERIILDWNEDYSVNAKKGFSPIGDDPNDILSNDFELKDLMGPEGRKMWDEYVTLKKKLVKSSNDNEKSELIHKIEKIGSLYNFS
jgi:predicted ATP-dependent endonuclease of OLD family